MSRHISRATNSAYGLWGGSRKGGSGWRFPPLPCKLMTYSAGPVCCLVMGPMMWVAGRGEEKDSSLTCSSAVQFSTGWSLAWPWVSNWELGFETQVESNCSFNTNDKNDITLRYCSNIAVHNKCRCAVEYKAFKYTHCICKNTKIPQRFSLGQK